MSVAAGMAQHVAMDLEREARALANAFDQAIDCVGWEWGLLLCCAELTPVKGGSPTHRCGSHRKHRAVHKADAWLGDRAVAYGRAENARIG
jgi:hypothetical protein